MFAVGFIAELNPFHNGHRHLIQQIRRAGATHVVALLGGNFTQRGEPALLGKFARARAALRCGVDLVAELPLPYAIAGAQRFARGGVALAAAMGLGGLAFGSESGDLAQLTETLRALDDPGVTARMKALLGRGMAFAPAREEAVREIRSPGAAAALRGANNALALEYLRAIRESGAPLEPFTIPRAGVPHDAPAPREGFASGSYLRGLCAGADSADALAPYIPGPALEVFASAPRCLPGALEAPLLSRLRALPEEAFSRLPELSEGLEHRLYEAVRQARTLPELYERMKTKRYPLARIRRLALAAFLGVTEELAASPPPYVRLLGYTARGEELLSNHRAFTLPVGASLARLERLGGRCAAFARLEAAAGDQYALLQTPRAACGAEYTAGVLRE